MKLPKPAKRAVIYEDSKLYVCLATFPLSKGHTVVVWKKNISDLGKLSENDYKYLMDVVDHVRNAIIKTLKIKKVYLLYMDEIKHVHWHLVPRYNQKGINALVHKRGKLKDFSLSTKIRKNLKIHAKNK